MKKQQKRWVCPTCGGGVLAPSRPRKDDVRRYCLPCSKKTGRLVERTCPSLEKVRAAKSEQVTARRVAREKQDRAQARIERQQMRERIRESAERAEHEAVAHRSVGGIDLLLEANRLWHLPYIKQQKKWQPALPSIEFRRSESKTHTSGHCWGHGSRARIVITIGTDPHDPFGTLLHEIVHAVLPDTNRHYHHDDRFWMTLRSAAREAWPDAPFQFNIPVAQGWQRQQQITLGLRAQGTIGRAAAPTRKGS